MSSNQSRGRGRSEDAAAGMGFSAEARQAASAAFNALNNWREELTASAERHNSEVFDRMAAAAKAMGWPAEFVEAARTQVESATKLQLQIIDSVADVWEQQLKAPGNTARSGEGRAASGPASSFGQFPGGADFSSFATMNPLEFWMAAAGMGKMPGMPDMGGAANPMQFWMQAAEMWQKSWETAFASWSDMQDAMKHPGKSPRR